MDSDILFAFVYHCIFIYKIDVAFLYSNNVCTSIRFNLYKPLVQSGTNSVSGCSDFALSSHTREVLVLYIYIYMYNANTFILQIETHPQLA